MKTPLTFAGFAGRRLVSRTVSSLPVIALIAALAGVANAQAPAPQLVDSNLKVRPVVTGLVTPTTMAFIGADDILVLEKNTGKVVRVVNGAIHSVVLDLAVNFGSERGLLGIALHPDFPADPGVYLYWTESTTGADTGVLSATTLLGNRVDRFEWNGATLTFDMNLIQMRALQEDPTNPSPRGNHNGGVLAFGPDGKLYIYAGDRGRRGQMQNLPDGPGQYLPGTPPNVGNLPDDQFGGPEPDDAHLTGVILRLNDDGTTPEDNPFYAAGARRGGEAGANIQKVFAYGIRNGFGMAFDPESGRLWEAQNGDDSFSEINRVDAGANLGWVQVMGPLARVAQFREIETSPAPFFGLQQPRWSPENIATTPAQVLARLFMIYEEGREFGAELTGAEEVPPVTTSASAVARVVLTSDNHLRVQLQATGPINNVTASHIHLGGFGQNGPFVAFLFQASPPRSFAAGEMIAEVELTDADIVARPTFDPTVANLAERIRQGRTYVNIHTTAYPAGEVRGQLMVIDEDPVSHYSDPEFSWKYEVAPAGLGFISGRALGPQYNGDMIVGAARPNLLEGHLFRLQLTGNRNKVAVDDPRLEDRVADNTAKYDITESEDLLFGTGFGISTDVETGPNGNLYVVSLTHGAIYEIYREKGGKK